MVPLSLPPSRPYVLTHSVLTKKERFQQHSIKPGKTINPPLDEMRKQTHVDATSGEQ